MKQEQRLVAEVYRFIAPFVDTTKSIYVSLDGQAAEMGVQRGLFSHPTIPDLWFHFIGSETPTLIEAKVVDKNSVRIMQSQLQAWRSSGEGAHLPQSWIATNRSFDRFFLWSHADMLPRFDASRALTPTVPVRLPDNYLEFANANELALAIIRHT